LQNGPRFERASPERVGELCVLTALATFRFRFTQIAKSHVLTRALRRLSQDFRSLPSFQKIIELQLANTVTVTRCRMAILSIATIELIAEREVASVNV